MFKTQSCVLTHPFVACAHATLTSATGSLPCRCTQVQSGITGGRVDYAPPCAVMNCHPQFGWPVLPCLNQCTTQCQHIALQASPCARGCKRWGDRMSSFTCSPPVLRALTVIGPSSDLCVGVKAMASRCPVVRDFRLPTQRPTSVETGMVYACKHFESIMCIACAGH